MHTHGDVEISVTAGPVPCYWHQSSYILIITRRRFPGIDDNCVRSGFHNINDATAVLIIGSHPLHTLSSLHTFIYYRCDAAARVVVRRGARARVRESRRRRGGPLRSARGHISCNMVLLIIGDGRLSRRDTRHIRKIIHSRRRLAHTHSL